MAATADRGLVTDSPWVYQKSTIYLGDSTMHVARPGGTEEIVSITGGEHRGPYGLFTGTLGTSTVEGYYGISRILDTPDRRGTITGVVRAAGGTIEEFFAGAYDGTSVLGARFFQRVPCGQPGALQKAYFVY